MPARIGARRALLSSSGGFAVTNPATNTLYSASADGTFVWTLEQPAAPDFLTQLRGGWRVQDLRAGGGRVR